jgi:hypothetical protein
MMANEMISILPATPKPGEGGFFSQLSTAFSPSSFLPPTFFVAFDRMKTRALQFSANFRRTARALRE